MKSSNRVRTAAMKGASCSCGGCAWPAAVPALVAAYIFAAYWFTASTSFANPAVTVARSLTTSFAGIRPLDVGGFVAAQFVGALLAMPVVRLLRGEAEVAPR